MSCAPIQYVVMYILFVLSTFAIGAMPAFADLENTDLLWKARALQAKERLNNLSRKKLKTKTDLCTERLERAFSDHLEPKLVESLRKNGVAGRAYSLRISSKPNSKSVDTENSDSVVAMTFTYDLSGQSGVSAITSLGSAWTALLTRTRADILITDGKSCSYSIDPFAPLKAQVTEEKTQ